MPAPPCSPGTRDAEQAELGHAGIDLAGKPLLLVELVRDRADHLVGEAADQVANLHVLGLEGHRSLPIVCRHDRPGSSQPGRPLGDGHPSM